MPGYRKLGKKSEARLSMLQGMTTDLILTGEIETTLTRAKEVKRIAEKMITLAIREKDNFTTKSVKVSKARTDSKGRKILVPKTSKNDKKYDVVERVESEEMVQVDNPSRLAARKELIKWLKKGKDADGNAVNPVNYLFEHVAPKYEGRPGGYCRIIKKGPRRGDAAEMVILKLV